MNIVIKVVGLIAVGLFTLADGGGFSTNIVTLNSRNWRKEVEESGQAVFINVWYEKFNVLRCLQSNNVH